MSVNDRRRPPFVWQSRAGLAAVRHCFSGKERTVAVAIYQAMTQLCNDERHNDTFTAARKDIADLAGVSDRTIDRYVETFERVGLLEVERSTGRNGSQPSRYTLVDEPPGGGEAASRGGRSGFAGGGEAASHPMETVQEEKQENDKKTTSAASATPEPQPEEQLFDAPPVEPERKSAAKRRAEVPDELVQQVWDHWLTVFDGKVRVKELTAPRERVIRSALLAVSLDVELCKRAIEGLRTYREKHSGDIQPSTIFETGPNSISNLTDQIEWWAQHAKSNLPSRDAIRDGDRPQVALDLADVPSVSRGTIQARRLEVVRMFTQPDASDAKERGEAAVDWLRDHVGHEPQFDGEHVTWHQVKA